MLLFFTPPYKYSNPTTAETKVDDNSIMVKLSIIIDIPHKARKRNTAAIANTPNFKRGSLRIFPQADSPYIPQAKKPKAIMTVMIYGKLVPQDSVNPFISSAMS